MNARLDASVNALPSMKAMLKLESTLAQSGLEASLYQLVKTRASQINGCAYCIHMHTRHALEQGESQERLFLLSAWHESPLYTARERAALAWTDALTLVSETHAPDDVYAGLKRHFNDTEIANLTVLIATINAWNRIAIGFRTVHPTQPHAHAA